MVVFLREQGASVRWTRLASRGDASSGPPPRKRCSLAAITSFVAAHGGRKGARVDGKVPGPFRPEGPEAAGARPWAGGSRQDSPAIRRDVVPCADSTQERTYGSAAASTGSADSTGSAEMAWPLQLQVENQPRRFRSRRTPVMGLLVLSADNIRLDGSLRARMHSRGGRQSSVMSHVSCTRPGHSCLSGRGALVLSVRCLSGRTDTGRCRLFKRARWESDHAPPPSRQPAGTPAGRLRGCHRDAARMRPQERRGDRPRGQ